MDKKKCLDILGLKDNATDDEIKKSFRKLAKQSHPDLNKDNINASDNFIKLKKAYDTLLEHKDKKLIDLSKITTESVTSNSIDSFFDNILNEFNRFFNQRSFLEPQFDLITPEPFVDLRKLVHERNRKKNKEDFF